MQKLSKVFTFLAAVSIYIIFHFSIVLRTRPALHKTYVVGNQDENIAFQSNSTERGNATNDVWGSCERIKIKVRQRLQNEMEGVNAGRRAEGDGPLRILLVARMRTGSGFLGRILKSYPGNYYLFEPLLKHCFYCQIRDGLMATRAVQDLKNLFQCRLIHGLRCFLLTPQTRPYSPPLCWLAKHWTNQKAECTYKDLMAAVCRVYPIQTVKTVRLRLNVAQKLLMEENDRLNLKILYLVRDPRAIMSSRIKLGWCQNASSPVDCTQSTGLCQDMVNEYYLAKELQQRYPQRFMTIKYETLGYDVYNATERIFQFLGLNFHLKVKAYLDENAKFRSGLKVSSTPSSSAVRLTTLRNTETVVKSEMTNELHGNFSDILGIQNACAEAIRLWGYEFLTRNI